MVFETKFRTAFETKFDFELFLVLRDNGQFCLCKGLAFVRVWSYYLTWFFIFS